MTAAESPSFFCSAHWHRSALSAHLVGCHQIEVGGIRGVKLHDGVDRLSVSH